MKYFLLTLAICSLPLSSWAEATLLDKIAAVVNNDIITQSQVERETQRIQRSFKDENRDVSTALIRKEVLDNLINEQLQMQEARKQRITIDNIALNREVERIAKSQNLTVFELYEKITAQGDDYLEYRERLRRQLAIQQTAIRFIRSRVKVSEQEITDYLNSDLNKQTNSAEYLLSLISVEIPEDADAAATTKAQDKIDPSL